jgi:hypothetical protein
METAMSETALCMSCRQQFPLGAVDIFGDGYRCSACSHRAQIADLNGTSQGAIQEKARTSKAWIGGLLLVAGIAVCVWSGLNQTGEALGPLIRWVGLPLVAIGTGSLVMSRRRS